MMDQLVLLKLFGMFATVVVAYMGIIATWFLADYAKTNSGKNVIQRANAFASGVLLSVALVHSLPDAIGDIGLYAPMLAGFSYCCLLALEIIVGGLLLQGAKAKTGTAVSSPTTVAVAPLESSRPQNAAADDESTFVLTLLGKDIGRTGIQLGNTTMAKGGATVMSKNIDEQGKGASGRASPDTITRGREEEAAGSVSRQAQNKPDCCKKTKEQCELSLAAQERSRSLSRQRQSPSLGARRDASPTLSGFLVPHAPNLGAHGCGAVGGLAIAAQQMDDAQKARAFFQHEQQKKQKSRQSLVLREKQEIKASGGSKAEVYPTSAGASDMTGADAGLAAQSSSGTASSTEFASNAQDIEEQQQSKMSSRSTRASASSGSVNKTIFGAGNVDTDGDYQSVKSMFRSVLLFTALMFHSVLEGLGFGSAADSGLASATLIAIVAHKGLAAFALGQTLLQEETDGAPGEGGAQITTTSGPLVQPPGGIELQPNQRPDHSPRLADASKILQPTAAMPSLSAEKFAVPLPIGSAGRSPTAGTFPATRPVTFGAFLPDFLRSVIGDKVSSIPVLRAVVTNEAHIVSPSDEVACMCTTSPNEPTTNGTALTSGATAFGLAQPLLTTASSSVDQASISFPKKQGVQLESSIDLELGQEDTNCRACVAEEEAKAVTAPARLRFLVFTQIFAFSTPLGALIGILTSNGAQDSVFSATCQSLSAGTFLQISVNELIPHALSAADEPVSENVKRLLALLLGFLIMSGMALAGA
ncbi:unnamed protein product [Amoebophrya sp. A25]|nr:unnamed protein product [Amoebophrya sp. A25]|eukprot:GSA25T00013833001.1